MELFFSSPVRLIEKKDILKNIINKTDPYIIEARKRNKKEIENTEDFGLVHHSETLRHDVNFHELKKFIMRSAQVFLNDQSYNLVNYNLKLKELWVQEFSLNGGGFHSTHVHSNSHVSGFYFLKASDKTSFPVFHDPRPGALMAKLPQKDEKQITLASEKFNIKAFPGLIILFNSYIPHEFEVDHGHEPFRFIHWNVQVVENE